MTPQTKTTKATTSAINANKATKNKQSQAHVKKRDGGQTQRQGIKIRGQDDHSDRSHDHRAGQIAGRDALHSDGRSDAGRGVVVEPKKRNTRRLDPVGDQR
jgi:hypothetical protein